MAYKIIDNFLGEDINKELSGILLGPYLPWYYNNAIVGEEEEDSINNFLFTHKFYSEHKWHTDAGGILLPIIDKLQPKALIRIKANINPRTPEPFYSGWHTDMAFPCKTAVYYVNSNDGYTEFENGDRVESIADRMLIFDSQMKHNGVSATNVKARCVINFNYFD